jgi:hypothetical protein
MNDSYVVGSFHADMVPSTLFDCTHITFFSSNINLANCFLEEDPLYPAPESIVV